MPDYPFQLTVIRSSRKTAAVQITGPDAVTARVPRRMPLYAVHAFLAAHRGWIDAHLQRARERAQAAPPPLTRQEVEALTAAAKADLPRRVERLAPLVGVSYGRVAIRCQKTRWGSCSAAGNLNFNCLLMLCPESVREYVVIHELCHRLHMDHSPAFWAQVARVMPAYDRARAWLRSEGQRLIARLPQG